jgi:hypothetical protein
MDPIRCVMLISSAGRVTKPESPQATPAEALFMGFGEAQTAPERQLSRKKKHSSSAWMALVPQGELLLFLCFGWMWRRVGIGAHDVVKTLFLVRGQKSPDFGMRGALA